MADGGHIRSPVDARGGTINEGTRDRKRIERRGGKFTTPIAYRMLVHNI